MTEAIEILDRPHPPILAWEDAMAQLMLDIEGIKPGARHDFARYNYSTADQVFDAVRPLLAKHGFSVTCDELDVKMTDVGTKSGGKLVLSTYAFMTWYAGEEVGTLERMTVGNSLTSPQSLCASRTYAMKYFLRTKFLINVNEKDEDQLDGPVASQSDRIRHAADPRAKSRQPGFDKSKYENKTPDDEMPF